MATGYETAGLLPSATLQPYGQSILKYGIGQLGTPINVGAMTPQVAGQSAFQQAGAQRVADMAGLGTVQRDATGQVTGFTGGTGVASFQPYIDQISQQNLLTPDAYKDFMSPYQREVIETTMADFDRQAAIQQKNIADQAFTAGAFGGARQGVESAEYRTQSDRNRAALLAGLYGTGFTQAQNQAQQQLGNLQTMAETVPALQATQAAGLDALGLADQQLEQQKLNQLALAAQTAYQLPTDRLTDIANIYGSIAGAMPGSPTQKFTPNPVVQGIGGFANMFRTLTPPPGTQQV